MRPWEREAGKGEAVAHGELKERAKQGDSVAACDLGILHLLGERGARKSGKEALRYFTESAEAGDARAADAMQRGLWGGGARLEGEARTRALVAEYEANCATLLGGPVADLTAAGVAFDRTFDDPKLGFAMLECGMRYR